MVLAFAGDSTISNVPVRLRDLVGSACSATASPAVSAGCSTTAATGRVLFFAFAAFAPRAADFSDFAFAGGLGGALEGAAALAPAPERGGALDLAAGNPPASGGGVEVAAAALRLLERGGVIDRSIPISSR